MSTPEHTIAQLQDHYVDHMTTDCTCTMFGTDPDEVQGYLYAEGPGYCEFVELSQEVERIMQAQELKAGRTRSSFCQDFLGLDLPLAVCQSAAGYYLGVVTTKQTVIDHPNAGLSEGEPLSRDSMEYWSTEQEASVALTSGRWIQRMNP